MVAEDVIDVVAERLVQVAPRGSRVILFGSYARGQAGEHSDLDFLVVEPCVKSRFAEMSRLREEVEFLVRPLRVGVDVLVATEETFDYWRDTPNTVYYRAAREGKVYGQVA